MKKNLLISLLSISCLLTYSQKIRYLVSFQNAIHHEANIQLVVRDIPKGPAIFRMSRSSPGRYATHEFGKNVYNVRAYDQGGQPIRIEKTDGDVYTVPMQDGYVNISYTLYGNYPDGTYPGITESSMHLNMPASFMWMKGMDNVPIEIFFDIPEGKKIATQLMPGDHPAIFNAPGLQYFMDSPVKIGDLIFKTWTIGNPDGKSYSFRLALEAKTNDSTASAFADKVKRIVQEAQAVYGEVPAYDHGTYTFLASINPWVRGDGMEHRNSTMISIPAQFDGNNDLLEVFAHEFFHCWNVERIRPKTLEPFNFEKSNMSDELWFAEGFTQYFGELLTCRSGYFSLNDYLSSLAFHINTKMVAPGGKFHSPVENSRMAVFVDAGVAIDKTNYPNIYSSYYPYGAAIALALDFELRMKYKLTLDNYMQAVWQKFGKTEIPYTIPGLQEVLEQLTNKNFASEFFSKYINGFEPYDYKSALEKAGLILKKAKEGKAWMGDVRYREADSMLIITSNTVMGTPLYEAGLDIDDGIINIAGKTVNTQKQLADLLETYKPGDSLEVSYRHRDEQKKGNITLKESPALTVVAAESGGAKLTKSQVEFRKTWLGSKMKL